jgi:hypothetical protein
MSSLFSTSLVAVPMEHQTAGVRPTRLRRAVSQPLDRIESFAWVERVHDVAEARGQSALRPWELGACPGHNYGQPYYAVAAVCFLL